MSDPVLTFESRAGWFGLPVRDVSQVATLRAVRPVPRAPGLVAGLAEVHGRVVALIDFDRLVGPAGAPERAEAGATEGVPATPAAGEAPCFGVVLAAPFEHLGLLVRSELDMADLPSEPPAEGGEAGLLLRARLPVGDRLLNLVALPVLVQRLEEAIRAGFRVGTDDAPVEG